MIIDFSITNYGPIRDKVTLSFESSTDSVSREDTRYVEAMSGLFLARYALIMGTNASGKTSLLHGLNEFLALINLPLKLKSEQLPYNPFRLDRTTRDADTEFAMNFVCGNERYGYTVAFNASCVTREALTIGADERTIYTRTTDVAQQVPRIKFGSDYAVDEHDLRSLESLTLWNNTVFGGLQKVSVQVPVLTDLSKWFQNYFTRIIEPGDSLKNYVIDQLAAGRIDKQAMVAWLRRADLMLDDVDATVEKLDDDKRRAITEMLKNSVIGQHRTDAEVATLAERMVLRNVEFKHITPDGKEVYINYEQESRGTQRFFQLAGVLDLILRQQRHFTIDEIDNSLHPDLVEFFLETYLGAHVNTQLIASTHQHELLLNSRIALPDAVWFTQKNASGATELYSLADFDDDIYACSDPLRKYFEAYRTGQLGAKPFMSSPYYPVD